MKQIILKTDDKNNTLDMVLDGVWSEIEVRGILSQAEHILNDFVAGKKSSREPVDLSEFK